MTCKLSSSGVVESSNHISPQVISLQTDFIPRYLSVSEDANSLSRSVCVHVCVCVCSLYVCVLCVCSLCVCVADGSTVWCLEGCMAMLAESCWSPACIHHSTSPHFLLYSFHLICLLEFLSVRKATIFHFPFPQRSLILCFPSPQTLFIICPFCV